MGIIRDEIRDMMVDIAQSYPLFCLLCFGMGCLVLWMMISLGMGLGMDALFNDLTLGDIYKFVVGDM